MAVLKKMQADNNINIKKKLASWRKNKAVSTIRPVGGAVWRVRNNKYSLH